MSRLWRAQLKLEASLISGHRRPRGMHQETYGRLRSKIIDLEKQRDQLMFEAIEARTRIGSSENNLEMRSTRQQPGANQTL